MELRIEKAALVKALDQAAAVTLKSRKGDGYTYQKLIAMKVNGAIEFEATNDEMYYHSKIETPFTNAPKNAIAMDAEIVGQVKRLAASPVTIDITEMPRKIAFATSQSRIEINNHPDGQMLCEHDFHKEFTGGALLATMSVGEFLDAFAMVRHVPYNGSGERSSYYTGGILFERGANSDRLHMVGTDGHRLAVLEVAGGLSEFGGEKVQYIVGVDALIRLEKILKKTNRTADLDIRVNAVNGTGYTKVVFQTRHELVAACTFDVKYPDYSKVIPLDRTVGLLGFASDIADALEPLRKVENAECGTKGTKKSEAGSSSIRSPKILIRNEENGTIAAYTTNPKGAQLRAVLPVEIAAPDTLKLHEMRIAVNPNYVCESLKASGGRVGIFWNHQYHPLTISRADSDNRFIEVIRPIRLDDEDLTVTAR